MKFKFLSLLFLSASLFIISCGDESCDNLSETVVGSWSIDESAEGTITMNSDGSLEDNSNVIFADSLDSATKTWDLSSTTLSLNADDGVQTNFVEFDVTSFDCDQLVTTNNGNTFTFNRN